MIDTPSRICRGLAAICLTAAVGVAALPAHAQGYRDYDRFDRGYGGPREHGYDQAGDRRGYYGHFYGPGYRPGYAVGYGGYYPAPYYPQPAYVVAPPAVYLAPRVVMAPRIAYAAPAIRRPVRHVAARHTVAAKPCLCGLPFPATAVSLPPIIPPVRLAPALVTPPPVTPSPVVSPPVFLEPTPPVGD